MRIHVVSATYVIVERVLYYTNCILRLHEPAVKFKGRKIGCTEETKLQKCHFTRAKTAGKYIQCKRVAYAASDPVRVLFHLSALA